MAQTLTFGGAGTVGGSTSLTPAPGKSLANTNYLSNADYTFAQQYLPDLYEKEFERYGNRSVASFLRMVGAEMPMTSDQVVWSEQGRLHLSYTGALVAATGVSPLMATQYV